jgi:septal ring factor EnvC (AmiA/AmiB activator)|uniref:hypothetical protein n=1 Tax=Bacteroides eggerthii TaxID=28111 RepID=UPI00291EE28E|nr:hypothetical protein AUSP0117_00029 [uncultured phage]
MYSFKEKKKHFNALLNPDAAKYDLELLIQKQPNLPIISTYSRNSKRYANDILYSLLDYSTREEIREFRRSKMNTETMTVDPSTVDVTVQATTTVDSQTPPVQTAGTPIDSSKVEEHEQPVTVTDSVGDTPQNGEGELQQQLEEAIERAEEAEANFEEAEEAKEEAEARAEVAEEALEEEKKKEKSQAPVKSKSKKSTRKSTGTTSSTRKSK